MIGIALGDGNLSNPNGRALRLRITCDNKYPLIKEEIAKALTALLPQNKISIVKRKNTFCDVSVYSNKLALWLPWRAGMGPKLAQKPRVPKWIFLRKAFLVECLKGLLHTDGSIYKDRGYTMVNFTNASYELARDVHTSMKLLGFSPTICFAENGGYNKYTVRLAKGAQVFLKKFHIKKA